eukprot:5036495-Pyramimonas_sp.AAC.1
MAVPLKDCRSDLSSFPYPRGRTSWLSSRVEVDLELLTNCAAERRRPALPARSPLRSRAAFLGCRRSRSRCRPTSRTARSRPALQ